MAGPSVRQLVNPELLLMFVVVMGLVGVAGGIWFIYAVGFIISCGGGYQAGMVDTLMSAVGGFDASSLVNKGACYPSSRTLWSVLIGAVVVLVFFVVAGAVAWSKWTQSDKKFLMDLTEREGIAKGSEVNKNAGRKALKKRAPSIRPQLGKKAKLSDVGRKLGKSAGQDVWMSAEDSVIVLGPPRSGKGFHLVVPAIIDSPGAVVTTSTRGDNVALTIKRRREISDMVIVFDPQGLSGVKSTLKWTPYRGCENSLVATKRADVLIGASGMGGSSNNQEWAEASKTILMYLLQAAALGKVSVAEFARWGQNADLADEAVKILRAHPKATPGWGVSLEGEINTDPKQRSSRWMAVQLATAALNVPEIAEALDPREGESVIDPVEFIKAKGTLYLVGSKSGGSSVAPFLIALMDEIVETAREMAFRMPGNRLDPPLSLILDEIANMAPWKSLPQIMADGGGVGISPFVIFQSPAQARGQWGADDAQALLDSAILQIQLGGSNNHQELEKFVALAGKRKVSTHSSTHSNSGSTVSDNSEWVDVITAAEIRRIPFGWAFMMPRNGRPIVMKMDRWIDRKDAKVIKDSKKEFEEQMQGQAIEVAAAPELAAEPVTEPVR